MRCFLLALALISSPLLAQQATVVVPPGITSLTGGVTATGPGAAAATVVTNANLTGPITSVGNATSIASQTGTGSKFVVDTSPVLVTPNLGTPSAAVLTSATGLPIGTGLSGLGAANRIPYATSTTALTTSSTLTYDGTTLSATKVGVGTTSLTGYLLRTSGAITGAATAYGIRVGGTVNSDVTSLVSGVEVGPDTLAAAFTLGTLYYFRANQGTIGSGSSVTTQTGFISENNLTGATNNNGFRARDTGGASATTGVTNKGFISELSTASGGGTAWNIFASGTAQNAFAGNVRIGSTTAPTVALDVTGAETVSGAVIFSGLGTDSGTTDNSLCLRSDTKAVVTGSGTLGVCLGTSSARYKRDIRPMPEGLAQVMALRPVKFFYKPGHGDGGVREQYGLLAEAVHAVLPELVSLDKNSAPNSVDLLGMVPVLIHAVQELQAQVSALKAEVASAHRSTRH